MADEINNPFAILDVPEDIGASRLLAHKPLHSGERQDQAYKLLMRFAKADRLDLLRQSIGLSERLQLVLDTLPAGSAKQIKSYLRLPVHGTLLRGTRKDAQSVLEAHAGDIDAFETQYERFKNARNLNVALKGKDSKLYVSPSRNRGMTWRQAIFEAAPPDMSWSEVPGKAATDKFIEHFMMDDGVVDAMIAKMEADNERRLDKRGKKLGGYKADTLSPDSFLYDVDSTPVSRNPEKTQGY